MIDMFVISGTDKFACQACGKGVLPLYQGDLVCKCRQVWGVSHCLGDPFARMELERTGFSSQSSRNPYYNAGWLVKAIQCPPLIS